MDTSLTLPPTASLVAWAAPVAERKVPTKVHAIERADGPATLPADKPFVAQVVFARLDGTAFPENPAEIAPPDRTLRPYGVPMLPFDSADDRDADTAAGAAETPATASSDDPGALVALADRPAS